jgi:hypothetical protein
MSWTAYAKITVKYSCTIEVYGIKREEVITFRQGASIIGGIGRPLIQALYHGPLRV